MNYFLKTLLFFSIFIHTFSGFSQISYQCVDPPFWWAGMEDSSLQLMFYGNKIAQSNVIVDYPGVFVKRTIRLENPNYIILDLEITKDARPGIVPMVFEYQREILFMVDYQLKSRTEGSKERIGFGKEDVIYLIMPDRFSNGDPDNDTIPGMLEAADRSNPDGRHGGDLVAERVPHGILAG